MSISILGDIMESTGIVRVHQERETYTHIMRPQGPRLYFPDSTLDSIPCVCYRTTKFFCFRKKEKNYDTANTRIDATKSAVENPNSIMSISVIYL